jgi:hypothetical protein
LQQAMVAEECNEVFGREVERFACRRRPDHSPHRREIVGQKPWREFAMTKILAECEIGQPVRGVVLDALPVEVQDVPEHPNYAGNCCARCSRCGGSP